MVMLLTMLALASNALAGEVAGPWQKGAYADIAVQGPIAHVIWVEQGTLKYTLVGGSKVETVATGVATGDGGGVRPEIITSGSQQPVIVYSTHTGLGKATRTDDGSWRLSTLGTGGGTGESLIDVALDKKGNINVVSIARLNGKSVVVFNGAPIFDGGADGVCMCCKPSLLARAEGMVVAFRDADGPKREIHWLRGGDINWLDMGDATSGGWSPGGCPADGPELTTSTMLVSDGRTGKRVIYEVGMRGEKALTPLDPAAEMLQPRALEDASLYAWVEATPGSSKLVVRDGPAAPQVVATSSGRMEPGDPVVVGGEVWLPWMGDSAHIERWQTAPPPGM